MEKSGRALVVFVHGFLGGRVQFLPMASAFSRMYDVFNYGYASRQDSVRGHAEQFLDTVTNRIHSEQSKRKQSPTDIHFVTHSFGGVVLHRAFADGLAKVLPDNGCKTRCVMIGPPLRGASFARMFQKQSISGPVFVRDVVHGTAALVMGDNCGAQLLMNDPKWFDNEIGRIPNQIGMLVIAGQYGRLNPLIKDASDGVVTLQETMMNRNHSRLHVNLTHNLMLCSPYVMNSVSSFLGGYSVGHIVSADINSRSSGPLP